MIVYYLRLIKNNIPNFFTVLNLVFGSIGVVFIMHKMPMEASFCIWIGAVCDLLDGLLARLLKAYSKFGEQVDSLADLITFGSLPSYLMFFLIEQKENSFLLASVSLLIVIFSAIRLAKFNLLNNDERDVFHGIPTPSSALFFSTFPMIQCNMECSWLNYLFNNTYFMLFSVLITSFLLISRLKIMAIKFSNWSWNANKFKFLFLFFSLCLTILFKINGVLFSYVLYILMSICGFR